MKIKKDIKVEEIVKIINTNTKETDFYLKDSNDLKVADMIKILKVGVSGKSLHISYFDVYDKFCGLAENSEEQKNDIKELKDLISAIQDFSKNNNTVYWYDEAENQEKETNASLIGKLAEDSRKIWQEFELFSDELNVDVSVYDLFSEYNDDDKVDSNNQEIDLIGDDA